MHDDDDTASWVTAIVTIANYALLIVMGFLRDLMFGKGRRDTPGYAPLLNDWQVLSCDLLSKLTMSLPPLQPHPSPLNML